MHSPSTIFIRHDHRYLKLTVPAIQYLEAQKNYCKVATTAGDYLAYAPMKALWAQLPPTEFVQIHRSFVVAIPWVTAFDATKVYGPGWELPIGDAYRRAWLERLILIPGPRTVMPLVAERLSL